MTADTRTQDDERLAEELCFRVSGSAQARAASNSQRPAVSVSGTRGPEAAEVPFTDADMESDEEEDDEEEEARRVYYLNAGRHAHQLCRPGCAYFVLAECSLPPV